MRAGLEVLAVGVPAAESYGGLVTDALGSGR